MIEIRRATVVAPTADGDATILSPTTLTLTERRVSVIGANGSGKSTLARLLNGLIEPTSGTVRVRRDEEAQDPASRSASASRGSASSAKGGEGSGVEPSGPWLDTVRDGAAVRRLVGFVFTDPGAQLVMPTAAEDVALSLRRTHRNKQDRRAAAIEALDRFGLAHLADRSVHTLSGGQRQLLAIASVLATDPAILVADEPTTLLDLRNSRKIGDMLCGLPQQLVLVTHDLGLAARADRTLVIDDSRVVFDGEPDAAIDFYTELSGTP